LHTELPYKYFITMRLILLISFILTSYLIQAQIGIEQWREHLPFYKTIAVTEGNNRIYCATPFSLFYYDRDEDALGRMSTVTGLSDVNISAIGYDKNTNYLIVAYENANIDLVYKGQIINISDIKRKSIVGSKRINKIIFRNSLVYLACDFGIVVLDPSRREIKDTYYIGPEGKSIAINDLDYDDSLFYAATSEGVYTASVNENNLSNYAFWHKDLVLESPNASYNCIAVHSSGLYVSIKGIINNTDSVLVKQNNQWNRFSGVPVGNVVLIKSYGDTIIFAQEYSFKYFYNNMSESFKVYTYGEVGPKPNDIILDHRHKFWIADRSESLVYNYSGWNYRFYQPSGPAFKDAYSMSSSSDQIWVAGGGIEGDWSQSYAKKGIYNFKDQDWSSYNKKNLDVFDSITDVLKIAINPANENEIFIGSWGKGIIQMRDNKVINVFNDKNSSLSQAVNYPGFIGVAGMAYDLNNYLWVTNTTNSNSLSFMRPDGYWQALSLSPYITTQAVGDLVIDDMGQKWIIIPRGGGIIVYNDNNTPETPYDDRKTKITAADNQGKLPSMGIYSLAKDKEGSIWVGTDKGVAVFYSPEMVFSGDNFDAQQIYVEQEGITQYLLESEVVTTIAIDGADRKWFGTKNAGVFLMSKDASEQIYHFTRENSPLLSNNIYSIGIEPESGEVFFGTENGIISFRSTATEAPDYQPEESITIFPNPVRPNYNGLIAIKGLVENASIKITDTYGNLVYETTALGGQAVWNGKNFSGERVATGVYLVFSSDDITGEQTATGKILFIK
jgi:ligand-binding sensor domain-containing protein